MHTLIDRHKYIFCKFARHTHFIVMKKEFFLLWLLLAVAFVIFKFTSFSQISEINERLSATGTSLNTASTETSYSSETIDVSSGEEVQTFPFPCDTTSKTILLIGDSMLEGLSPRLAAYAEENSHTLYSVIWYSSTSERWGKSTRLADYIAKLNPDYIFISLGGNELFVTDIKKKRDKYVKKIISDIGNIPFVWIGPPNWKPDTGINDLIAENTPQGTFFLSNGMTFQRANDGAHPTRSSAALWVDSIARWMPEHARYPIKMHTPRNSSSKPKRLFVHSPNEE